MTASVMDRSDTARVVVLANGLLSSFGKPSVRKFERKADDGTEQTVYAYSGVPVFRSGTFSDSMGFEREWLPEQIDQMAANFRTLHDGGYFPDPPVRKGHPGIFADTMDGLIGYVTDLRTETRKTPLRDEDEEFRYLLADYEILDAAAQAKIDSGLWRHRSAEIGMYATNNPVKEFWPTFMGVGYVDIPAVEGLNGFARRYQKQIPDVRFQEEHMTTPATKPDTPAPANGPSQFKIGGVDTTDHARVQNYIGDLEKRNATLETANAAFGKQVTELTAFRTQAIAAAREQRITDLARPLDGRPPVVTAPQLEGIKAFAAKLDDDQFSAYMATMETREPNPLFAKIGTPAGDQGAPAVPEDQDKARKDAQYSADAEIVVNLRNFGGMSAEALEKTESFQRLKAAGYTGSPMTLTTK